MVGVVAGRGGIDDARVDCALGGLGDDAVVEHRLVEVGDVVGDDLGAGAGQALDAVGEGLRPPPSAVLKASAAPGAMSMDDLQHGPALIGAHARRVVREHLDVVGRSPRRHRLRQPPADFADRVGDHAHLYARAVHALGGMKRVGLDDRDAFRGTLPTLESGL